MAVPLAPGPAGVLMYVRTPPGVLVYETDAWVNLRLLGEMFIRENLDERLSYWGTGGKFDDDRVLTRGR